MDESLVRTLVVGRDERTAERFLLLSVGASAATFCVLVFGQQAREYLPDVVGVLVVFAYLVGTLSFAGAYASRNGGALVTLLGTFVLLSGYGVFFGLTNVVCLGSGGCPTLAEKLSYGVLLAAGAALPVGSTAFAVGAGGRRLRERRTGS